MLKLPEEDKQEILSALNQILKGENMAINLYHDFIEGIEDEKPKKLLEKFQKDHQNHASTLSNQIKDLGGNPKEGTGFSGVMSNAMMEIGNILGAEPKTEDILEKIYNGEQKGLEKVEELKNENLDSQSQQLVDDIIATDHQHLKEIEKLLGE